MVVTKGSNGANRSESLKTTHLRLFSAIREHEDGITSNRGSARHGESVPEPCTHRPSRSGIQVDRKGIYFYYVICLPFFNL